MFLNNLTEVGAAYMRAT